MSAKTKFWVNLIVVFLLGFALGMTADKLMKSCCHSGPSHKSPEEKLDFFSRKVGLREEQKEAVREIFQRHHREIRALHAKVDPEFERIREDIRREIEALLDPQQRERFLEFREKMDRWRANRDQHRFGSWRRRNDAGIHKDINPIGGEHENKN